MGEPARQEAVHHFGVEPTQGTETSQYLQENKESIDFPSSGERKGKSLNRRCFGTAGVVGVSATEPERSGIVWKGKAQRVTPPYTRATGEEETT